MDDLLNRLQAALADRYAVEKEIGRGGMSTVYLARDLRHGRSVALKVLDPALAERVGHEAFLNEMQVTARLQHPLILPLHDSGEAAGLLFYVMPFVEGETLRDRLRREGQLPVADAIRIAREVADALAYAHEKNVVHRDIKPENILLTGGHAMVADFGIARALQLAGDSTIRMGEGVSGTPAYMSPEQAMGESGDARSDVYSLGCVLYEMLAGHPPFMEPTVSALLKRVLVETPAPVRNHRSSAPELLNQVIAKSLEKIPADRWASAAEFGASLSAVQDTQRTLTAVPGPPATSNVLVLRVAGFLIGFAVASFLVLLVARALIRQLGLPDWVLAGTVVVLALGLPVLLATLFSENRVLRFQPGSGTHRWFTWRNAILGGGLAFFALALLVSAYMFSRKTGIGPGASLVSAGVLEERDRILIADFENATSDSLLGPTLKEALTVDLSQSPSVTIVPVSQIAEALKRMQRDPKTPLTTDLAREMAIREGMKGILTGELRPLGKGYVLSAKLLSVPTGEVLLAEREGADGSEGLIQAVDRLSKKLRERIGESLKSIRANKPLAQVTTTSLSALQKYSQAVVATEMEGNDDKAIALLDEAVDLDTTFAMAYRKLSTVLGNLQRDPVKEYQATMMSFRLRERLPDRERYLTEGNYYSFLNDWDQAALAYQKLLDLNPEDAWALNNAGVVATQLGQREQALDYYRRAHAVEPSPLTFSNIVNEEAGLGRYDDAEKSLQEFEAKFPGNWQIARNRFWITASRGEYDVAERLARARIEALKNSPFMHARAMGGLGIVLAAQGRLQEAERYWRQGVSMLDEAEISIRLYMMENFAFETLFIREDPRAARAVVEQMRSPFLSDRIAPEQRRYLELIGLYSMVGDPAGARSLLAEYKSSVNPLVQKAQEVDLHRTMGLIALAEHRPQEAIQELSIHQERRAGSPHIDLPLIGRAYEESGLPDSAIAVYERYLTTHDVLRFIDDTWYLAGILVRLGDLYQERGDRIRAIEYYSRFVELWKNADPELQPRVRAVKSKLETLAGESRS